MQLWHRLSLEQKTLVILAGFFLLASVNAIAVFIFQNQNATDAREIAALQNVKAKVSETVKLLSGTEAIDDEQKLLSERTFAEYSQLLEVFTNGGRLAAFDVTVEDAGENEKVILQDINGVWDQINNALNTLVNAPERLDTIVQRVEEVPISDTLDIFTSRIVSDIQSIPNPAIGKARGNISLLWSDWQLLNTKYLNFLLNEYESQQRLIYYVSVIFWVFTLLALLMLFVGVRKHIFQPLQEIIGSGEKISEGAYNVAIKDYGNDEVGVLGKVFNKTADTLKSTASFLTDLGEGKLNEEIKISGDKENDDQTIKSALVSMRQQLKNIEEEEKERKWISEGLATFGDLLRRNNENLETLTDKVTASLVKYTGSLVGGIYLLNEEESPVLELLAFYALDIKKYNKKSYKPGEGLVGQTYLEEDYIYLLEIPENYISITSGVGETSPKAILLVPLKVEEEVFGVIELASLREYKEYEIEFVRKLTEIIASTIQNVKINQRTKRLLDESQEMTEQMRSQEEEMRQNMEEISATQEEMARKEQEMVSRLEAIDNTLALSEYNIDKTIVHVNKNFTQLFKADEEDLIGLSHKELVPETEHDLTRHLELWKELKKGKAQSGEFHRKRRDGHIIEISATYTPVKDGSGEVIKIIELAEELKIKEVQSQSQPAAEIDKQLRQNLEALEITNRKLAEKYIRYEAQEKALKGAVIVAEVDDQGNIFKGKDELIEFFNRPLQSIMEIESLEKDIFVPEQKSGHIKGENKEVGYSISRINNNRYLFLLFNI